VRVALDHFAVVRTPRARQPETESEPQSQTPSRATRRSNGAQRSCSRRPGGSAGVGSAGRSAKPPRVARDALTAAVSPDWMRLLEDRHSPRAHV
jgi:hypothetical protein